MRSSLLAVAALCVSYPVAFADTINFTYVGAPDSGSGLYENTIGTGTFSFAGPASTVSEADLSSFSFSYTLNQPTRAGSFSYTLTDLTSFSATLSGANLLTLSLGTKAIGSFTNPDFNDESFVVTSLAPGGANTLAFSTTLQGVATTTGQVSETSAAVSAPIAATPELSSIALLGTGVVGAIGFARKRFASE